MAGGKEADTMCLCKGLYLCIFSKIGLALVLYIVIQGVYELFRVLDPRCAHGHELLRYRPRIVVRHAAIGFNLHIVAAANDLSRR